MTKFKPTAPAEFDFKDIIYTKENWTATVTINRPAAYNAYSTECVQELCRAFTDAAWDDSVAVVVLTGAGHRAFCTGGDVKEYATEFTVRPRDYWKWMGLFTQAHDLYRNIGKPTLARLNGMVVGGGNEWNLSSDLAVIGEHGYIRQVGTSVGSVACGGATQFLPLVVGDRRAREILWFNEPIDPHKAKDWGLVNEVAPTVTLNGQFLEDWATPEQIKLALKGKEGYAIDLSKLDDIIADWVVKLVEKFPECQRYTKQQANYWKDLAWSATIGHAREWLALHYASWEPTEGMHAFVEKRPADYRGIRARAAAGESSEFMWGPYTRACTGCGAKGIPAMFDYCGACGAALKEDRA